MGQKDDLFEVCFHFKDYSDCISLTEIQLCRKHATFVLAMSSQCVSTLNVATHLKVSPSRMKIMFHSYILKAKHTIPLSRCISLL